MQPAASDLVDHRVHAFFQASTVEALYEGKLEGDLSELHVELPPGVEPPAS